MSGDSGADDIIGYSFLTVFANDNTIDSEELAFLKSIALRDGQLDADEREILGALFSRIDKASLAGDVASEIQQFKEQFQIP